MKENKGHFKVIYMLFGLLFLSLVQSASGQSEPDDEIQLAFNHPSVGQIFISTAIFDNIPFLPIGEVLNLFEIPAEQVLSTKGLRGYYPGLKDFWEVNPTEHLLTYENVTVDLPEDLFYLGEMDLFLHPKLLSSIFGLDFTFSINSLSLSMNAAYSLPIVEKRKRELARKRSLQMGNKGDLSSAPLLYPRHRKLLRMGMIDYNINQLQAPQQTITRGLFNVGLEALGGDLIGTLHTIRTAQGVTAQINNLRWRYVLPDAMDPTKNVALTSVSAGDIVTRGRSEVGNLLGVSLTNDPIVPRQQLDLFVIDGYTEPDSEVEMLLGGQMADFTRADEMGYYRFNTPINFGAQRLSIRIYTPQGKVIQEDRQIQIPFTFLPRGFVSYSVQAGLPRIGLDSVGNALAAHTNLAYGISNSITARVGSDYNFSGTTALPYSYLGFSARVFQQYLVNADVVPRRYALADASVFFPNNTNITAQYKEYFQDTEFNMRGNIRDISLNMFWPFRISGQLSGIRLGGIRMQGVNQSRNSLLADFNTQIRRMVARFNFRGNLSEFHNLEDEIGFTDFRGVVTSSFTYTLSRNPDVPVYVRGMFLRGQLVYNPFMRTPTNYGILLSQTLFKRGRFTFGYDRNLLTKTGKLQIGFLYDFNFLRSSSQYQTTGKDYGMTQAFTGSLAYDPTGVIIPSNRDQVNRAGVAVKLYIDDNNNGIHDEEELIVSAKAARLDRSASAMIGSDGILRLSQLQSYWTYRMEIDKNALPDPTLAPRKSTFSFVADPNHYRMIEVPLYRTGTIEGTVYRENEQKAQNGVGGLRLLLTGEDEKTETIRTFNDGSFYTYGITPGRYTLQVDPQQLNYIGMDSKPGIKELEIKAIPDGDYIEGLDFLLIEAEEKPEIPEESKKPTIPILQQESLIQINMAISNFFLAQKYFYEVDLEAALEAIDASLAAVKTGQALILKGTIYLKMGMNELGKEYLEEAEKELNNR